MGELLSQYDVLGAFWVNIQLTFFSAIGALIIGTILAVMRISPSASLRWAGATYVNVVRNTPLTLIILGCWLVLWGQLGVNVSADLQKNNFWMAVIGLSVYTAAFVCESLRSGFNTVPVGQAEAARSIGLGFTQTVNLVVLPQAFRGAIAPLGNTLIALTKNSTVAAAASVLQASTVMQQMIEFSPQQGLAIFMVIALGFVVIVFPMGLLFTWMSTRLAVAR
ncbi:ABC transporter permease [Bowdeniella nasicola]|uniref:ABC transporter permease n=1 Tax=Bowdeniella nasicola TaxID=208480 RepID=A0A1Q5Q5W1_9ACTO|nr:amino acid ABC transporter permease [Bowdeniella nasicola]OKL55181.1 ABC transporter permease [Bowdeniella nasicola]